MKTRKLGKTGLSVSEIGLGTWQVGGKWGSPFNDAQAEKILEEAVDAGVNFIDTADVYENRKSEAAVGRVVRRRKERIYTATKCGRMISPHVNQGYTKKALRGYVEESLRNSGLDVLDLIQLHCPPGEVYSRPEIFELFDQLKEEGKILNLGVSVETIDQALQAMAYPNVTTIQIIFNIFRQRPAEVFFKEAEKRNVGVIVRVPLASGLLTGRFTKETVFGSQDHRQFNREGAAFDKGETFAGVPYETGLAAVEELKALWPESENLAPWALRWILEFPQVSTIIPGASRPSQLTSNIQAAALPPLSPEVKNKIERIYQEKIKPLVHHLW